MKTFVMASVLLISSLPGYVQGDCGCRAVVAQVAAKVEAEYPGFSAYASDPLAYARFKDALLTEADSCPDAECLGLLKRYTGFFRHGHLSIVRRGESSSLAARGDIDTVDLDLSVFLAKPVESRRGLEGIWVSANYEVGVIHRGEDAVAFIIDTANRNWRPLEVKFKIQGNGAATYFMSDHSPEPDSISVIDDSIIFFKEHEVSFVRKVPLPPLSADQISRKLDVLEGFSLTPLSDKTLLLRISSFAYEDTDRIVALINDNRAALADHDNLVIDVRGNGGGTDYSYQPLLPFLYTNPVRHLGGEYFVTSTLISSLRNWVATADPDKFDDIDEVKADLERMEGHLGQFIPYHPGPAFGYSVLDSVYPYPNQVAILIDGGCGSSTEKFILDAKQSRKVKTFGTPTYGSVDYLSVIEFSIECSDYVLFMPTVRTMRSVGFPLDNIGIQPDIYLDQYVEDWVSYACDYLETE